MMNTAQLKIDLISQITNITDEVKLKEIRRFLKFQSELSTYVTTEEEKAAISAARSQIAKGEVISNKDVQKDIRKWLKS